MIDYKEMSRRIRAKKKELDEPSDLQESDAQARMEGAHEVGGRQEPAHETEEEDSGRVEMMAEGGDVLDANARKHIAPDNFALPGGRYPIHDIVHARNALARVAQHGTPEEQAEVRRKVHAKYPSLAGDQKAMGGDVMPDMAAAPEMPSMDEEKKKRIRRSMMKAMHK